MISTDSGMMMDDEVTTVTTNASFLGPEQTTAITNDNLASISTSTTTTTTTSEVSMEQDESPLPSAPSQPQPPPQLLFDLDSSLFLYQNNISGQISTTHLSLRQLCRILGVATAQQTSCTTTPTTTTTATTSETTTTSNTSSASSSTGYTIPPPQQQQQLRHVTADTNVLLYDQMSTSYSPNGWQSIRTVPVLRDVVTPWYYYYYYNIPLSPTDTSTTTTTTTNTTTPTTQGPISCRDLAKVIQQQQEGDQTNDVSSSSMLYASSPLTDMTWKTLQELPNLQLALAALYDNNANHNTNDDDDATHSNNNHNHLIAPNDNTVVGVGVANNDIGETTIDTASIQAELEAFLQSTTTTTSVTTNSNQKRTSTTSDNDLDDENDNVDECSYQSDHGTRYIKDHSTGNWIHEAYAASSSSLSMTKTKPPPSHLPTNQRQPSLANERLETSEQTTKNTKPSNKSSNSSNSNKKAKFANKYSRNWIYVTGLPTDINDDTTDDAVTEQEVATVFSKAGLLDLDPLTQLPKVKLYRYNNSNSHDNIDRIGQLKGDASICYARPESVSLAITLLDDTPFRFSNNGTEKQQQQQRMTVQAAKFEQHGTQFDQNRQSLLLSTASTTTTTNRKQHISNTQRKVAKLAAKQAMDWDDGGIYNNGRITGGKKGLCIIVLKHSFEPKTVQQFDEEQQDEYFSQLEHELRIECERYGAVEKITLFTSHPLGIAIVKFVQPVAASDAVQRFNRQVWKDRKMEATFWDGVTDYTVQKNEKQEEQEMAVREEEFGNWLETQELPEELQLQNE